MFVGGIVTRFAFFLTTALCYSGALSRNQCSGEWESLWNHIYLKFHKATFVQSWLPAQRCYDLGMLGERKVEGKHTVLS